MDKEIGQRLKIIDAVIPIDSLLHRKSEDPKNISRYYRLNRLTYRLLNSKNGYVHMGISYDGIFKEDDFLEQGRIISRYIHDLGTSSVLELAAGKGATAKYLSAEHPKTAFTGLDLPDGQLDTADHTQPNLTLVEGDYHDLSQFEPHSFDIVYVIEALCHARSKPIVVEQVHRVLKPGGLFIIFDGYSTKSAATMTKNEALVSDLIYTSMMVTKHGHLYTDLRQHLRHSKLKLIKDVDLSQGVLPSMKRLESKARLYFKYPILAKLINSCVPLEITGNTVAAYLMPLSIINGTHQYRLSVAQKSND